MRKAIHLIHNKTLYGSHILNNGISTVDLVYNARMPICGIIRRRITKSSLEESPTIATKLKKNKKRRNSKSQKKRENRTYENK